MTRFDRVTVVDWLAASAAPRNRPQADAIWIGLATAQGVTTAYHPSRHAAEPAVPALIAQTLAARETLLAGFDFPMGYPDGFAHRLPTRSTARPTARPAARPAAVWRWLADAITDGPDNRRQEDWILGAGASHPLLAAR